MKYFRFLILLVFNTELIAQSTKPVDYGLKPFSISDKKLGIIRFYVDTTNIDGKAPLFIDINGSGGLPLCFYVEGKKFSAVANTFNTSILNKTKEKYHYVILDKPGTPFCDTIRINQDAAHYDIHKIVENYKFSGEYTQRLSLQWRVEATKKVINYLIIHHFWDKTKIVAFGYSEGGQVVPTLAVEDKRITHIVPIAGSGLNQFYDGIIRWRIKAAKGEVTQQQAQDSINAFLQIIRDVYKNPSATDKEMDGHSYKRWASFGLLPPFEQLRKLNIPIYMIVGTDDDNSPIYGLDYIELDFIRLGKTNLTYDPCVGCNHYLISDNYIQKILDWIDKTPNLDKPEPKRIKN